MKNIRERTSTELLRELYREIDRAETEEELDNIYFCFRCLSDFIAESMAKGISIQQAIDNMVEQEYSKRKKLH